MSTSAKAAQIIRCINASISCLASTFIMLMILIQPNEKGLTSPYSRIIFAMSISDILLSSGLLLSPFMSPKDNPDALFAIGTTTSCEAIGFLFILGFQCLLFYTLLLTFYFMKRIKYKVTPQNFAKKQEKYFHIAFIIISFSLAIACLATGSMCNISPFPQGCNRSPDVICERGGKFADTLLTVAIGLILSCFAILIFILGLTTHHVYSVEREFTISARRIGAVRRSALQNHSIHEEEEEFESEQIDQDHGNSVAQDEPGEERRKRELVLTKQAFHQSLLYIAAFILVYLGPMIAYILLKFRNVVKVPEFTFWIGAMLTPLGGLFNILIYTRPKVLKMQERYPDVRYIGLFLAIVISAGEIPSMADLYQLTTRQVARDCNQRNHGNEREDQSQLEQELQEERDIILFYDMDISDSSEMLSSLKNSRFSFLFFSSTH